MPAQAHMQSNMQVPDELLALFSRNLTFNPELQAAMANEQAQQQAQQAPPAPSQQPIYSASQHYTHSYHVSKPRSQDVETDAHQAFQRPSSAPLENEASQAEALLRSHGVEPSLLTPSQLQLFKTADDGQKLRLLELWSICPPSGAQNIPALAWSSTSLEQEEHLARVRYTREQQQMNAAAMEEPPIEQIASGHWTQPAESEPYMTSGYEELMRREHERNSRSANNSNAYCHFGSAAAYNKATDPIYLGPDFVREQQQMEMASQYGAFEQFRCADAMDVII
ncbi:hypothetical protein ISF_01997 [Cordyceps fumosorosea ARSEF 2679]|uniref:Uncharacterized protein n=1 Tax=Cordyceps fumosorosea (strain ARSEF 2679) TaxID=1081104 RepID=A0A168CJ83_CORFA|nr:hypothetical protein ISF_01997 [Cordyceps fumosorosea ARSEF 2679]OAA71446.1 hypothetical protein ISF_01997 [Cordyceps fumosorosea ARSEF 2679]